MNEMTKKSIGCRAVLWLS